MSAYLDIIFLLIVAVLILMRLYSVLGTRPEQKTEIRIITKEEFEKNYDNIRQELARKLKVADVSSASAESESDKLNNVLAKIPGFNRVDFCTRVMKVFEMILAAFAERDEKTLQMLTGKKLFAKFQEIIKQREEEGITAETDLIKVEELCIADAKISAKGVAQIVVRFISEQVNLLKNAAGEVIEGDENFVQKITDIWTFERDVTSNSPVWLLVSTKKK